MKRMTRTLLHSAALALAGVGARLFITNDAAPNDAGGGGGGTPAPAPKSEEKKEESSKSAPAASGTPAPSKHIKGSKAWKAEQAALKKSAPKKPAAKKPAPKKPAAKKPAPKKPAGEKKTRKAIANYSPCTKKNPYRENTMKAKAYAIFAKGGSRAEVLAAIVKLGATEATASTWTQRFRAYAAPGGEK